ncbi:PDDEXK-like family protein [Psychroflexus halocasei]|uniref:PD-(D/E)XK nuclease superfamily protein n=1 Tax=Psychroflexus halocasei TaxID=908615 RepID=A0A1H3VE80_9FLAO|nr:PD-(D/E)XK nuclease family protein [Psychroflexus halocasei]SDZ73106.1 PD-(D/E)XK nuclease superfamily protein [Psychroflexus halocasei]
MTSQTIQNLLDRTYSTHEKYKQIEKLTGENFNIFSILRKSQDELAHSRFIGNLLNSKGSHGQDSLYLELFIDIIQQKFDDSADNNQALNSLNELNLNSSRCIKEKWLGKIDSENETGGSIDLLITDGNTSFLIENKIWAEDQDKQLVRYGNAYSKAPIFYLTLFDSNEVSDASKGSLIENKDFFKISYETDILVWIQKCIEKSASKPIVRESLRQYEFLIKKNTLQNNSKIMEKDIIDVVLSSEQNTKAFENLVRAQKRLKYEISNQFVEDLKAKVKEQYKDYQFENKFKKDTNWDSFYLQNEYLRNYDLKISFSFFEAKSKTKLKYGFSKKGFKKDEEPFKSIIKSINKSKPNTNKRWLFSLNLEYYNNWESMDSLRKYKFDDDYKNQVLNYFMGKIDEMVQIVEKVKNNSNE